MIDRILREDANGQAKNLPGFVSVPLPDGRTVSINTAATAELAGMIEFGLTIDRPLEDWFESLPTPWVGSRAQQIEDEARAKRLAAERKAQAKKEARAKPDDTNARMFDDSQEQTVAPEDDNGNRRKRATL